MNTSILNDLSLLKKALSNEYRNYFRSSMPDSIPDKARNQLMNIYSSYCFLVKPSRYSGFDILNDENAFNQHFEILEGFIYQQSNLSIGYRYEFSHYLQKTFEAIAHEKQLQFNPIKLPRTMINDGVQHCIDSFIELNHDIEKANYLDGWQVYSKEGKKIEINLDSIYIQFGIEFTQLIHKGLEGFSLTQKTSSLRAYLPRLKSLFNTMTLVCPDANLIYMYLDKNHVHDFFQDIMNLQFVSHIQNQNNPKAFFKGWRQIIIAYIASFIDSGIFDEPRKPFLTPTWKSPRESTQTFSSGGQASEKEKRRWFFDIPLKIKDEEAIQIIQSRLNRDLEYIRHVCMEKFEELRVRYERNDAFIQTAYVKPLKSTKYDSNYRNFVGVNNLANTVATFYEHGIGAKKNYPTYLGYSGRSSDLIEELNLPTESTLAVILTLLIMEHPLITPSWLSRWELFDKNGNQTGFKQAGNQYIATSYKARKGASSSQQDIVLNDFSKTIIEFLIQFTSVARKCLKKNGDDKWRRMILLASLTNATYPLHFHNFDTNEKYKAWLSDASNFGNDNLIDKASAIELADLVSLRSIRKHRGMQIYLVTRSMAAVSEALGHKKMDLELLASYLPKPLMDFFNDRWIRQFQNAILLEAMKDSPYCLDVVNMTTGDIEEFLENHGINKIPTNSECNSLSQSNDTDIYSQSSFDLITYTISTSLLQLLIAIRCIVESNVNNEHTFLDIVIDWYQSAIFILNSLTTEQYNTDIELLSMLKKASESNLDTNLIIGALTC